MEIFYLNGQFVSASEAKISILDLGFVRGYGVFDFLRTYNGQPFKLDEHLKRLESSADQIGLKLPKPLTELRNLVLETLAKNILPEANIKIIVSGGVSPDQITPGNNPTLAVLVYPPIVYPKSFYEEGVKAITVPLVRSFSEAKTLNYISGIIALNQARQKKAVEALYKNEKNEVTEGTTTNFFIFKDKNLITSKDGILKGITREIVLEIAAKEYPIKLRPVKYNELKTFDEAFIVSTTKEIMPVVRIDGIMVGDGKVGERTKRLMKLFRAETKSF